MIIHSKVLKHMIIRVTLTTAYSTILASWLSGLLGSGALGLPWRVRAALPQLLHDLRPELQCGCGGKHRLGCREPGNALFGTSTLSPLQDNRPQGWRLKSLVAVYLMCTVVPVLSHPVIELVPFTSHTRYVLHSPRAVSSFRRPQKSGRP